jgi:uncharacterized protein YggE
MLRNVVALSAIPFMSLAAQDGTSFREPPPAISVSSSSEVKITPDRATIHISVQTKHETAATAASENAQKQTAVINAIKKLGITDDQISTVNYNVSPAYRYEPNRDPILTGYTVTNTVVVELRDIKQVGAVIDAALTNGSNMISSLDFYASNTEAARRDAIAKAVAKAKAEAEVAAQASGGTLGTLLDLNISAESGPMPPMPLYAKGERDMVATSAATPINPGDQTVRVVVYTRWRFNAGR